MAIKPEAAFPGKSVAGDADYPQGSAQDITTPGDATGTPWVAVLINDIWGLLQRLLSEASITPSGNADTVQASDYYDALESLFASSSTSASETAQGIIELATQAEVNAGTDTGRAVTPATLKNKTTSGAWQTPTLSGGWAFPSDNPLRYRLAENGTRLEVFGTLDAASASAVKAFTLPSGYRPSLDALMIFSAVQDPLLSVEINGWIDENGDFGFFSRDSAPYYPTGLCSIHLYIPLVTPW